MRNPKRRSAVDVVENIEQNIGNGSIVPIDVDKKNQLHDISGGSETATTTVNSPISMDYKAKEIRAQNSFYELQARSVNHGIYFVEDDLDSEDSSDVDFIEQRNHIKQNARQSSSSDVVHQPNDATASKFQTVNKVTDSKIQSSSKENASVKNTPVHQHPKEYPLHSSPGVEMYDQEMYLQTIMNRGVDNTGYVGEQAAALPYNGDVNTGYKTLSSFKGNDNETNSNGSVFTVTRYQPNLPAMINDASQVLTFGTITSSPNTMGRSHEISPLSSSQSNNNNNNSLVSFKQSNGKLTSNRDTLLNSQSDAHNASRQYNNKTIATNYSPANIVNQADKMVPLSDDMGRRISPANNIDRRTLSPSVYSANNVDPMESSYSYSNSSIDRRQKFNKRDDIAVSDDIAIGPHYQTQQVGTSSLLHALYNNQMNAEPILRPYETTMIDGISVSQI